MLNPPVNGKIQGLIKVFECFSSTFQGKLNFQGLFKTVLYIQVLFKSVRTLEQQGSGETVCLPKFLLSTAACICDMHQNLMNWLV